MQNQGNLITGTAKGQVRILRILLCNSHIIIQKNSLHPERKKRVLQLLIFKFEFLPHKLYELLFNLFGYDFISDARSANTQRTFPKLVL